MKSHFLIIFLYGFGGQAAAAPVPGQYVAWQNEPYGRGTWSILSSCITTLVLCVYTAVHMNVRPAWEDPKTRKWHVMLWVFAGIFAPELVVWTAWCQWSEARLLTKELQELRIELNTQNGPTLSNTTVGDDIELIQANKPAPLQTVYDGNIEDLQKLLDSWTMQHSFFVVMGGYQFRPEANDAVLFGWTDRRIVLNRRCFVNLLRGGYAGNVPLLLSRDLADRSKADSLAKILSCVQGTWLIFQLLGRVMDHLSITELEVNTFAHVICAIAMYALWISKPLNVHQPVFVASQGLEGWLKFRTFDMVEDFHSFLASSSHEELPTTCSTGIHVHTEYKPPECHQCERNRALSFKRNIHGILLEPAVTMTPEDLVSSLQQNEGGWYIVDFVYRLTDDELRQSNELRRGHKIRRNNYLYRDGNVCRDCRRRNTTVCGEDLYQMDSYDVKRFLKLWSLPRVNYSFDQWSETLLPTKYTPMILPDAHKQYGKILLMLSISSVYGGLHASLWNHHFPTIAEMWIWRVASLVVAGSSVFLHFSLVLLQQHDDGWTMMETTIAGYPVFKPLHNFFKMLWSCSVNSDVAWVRRVSRLIGWVVYFMYCAIGLISIFGRTFLFIDAFLTLRSQPPSVYQTPQWSQWLPHL